MRAFLFLIPLLLLLAQVPPNVSGETVALQIGQPVCSFPGEVPLIYNATVDVEVTSSNPIQNVTLYYRTVNGTQVGALPDPENLSLYRVGFMNPANFTGDEYRYYVQLPRFPNYTEVYGFVKAVDVRGNAAYSNGQSYPLQICYYSSPAPKATLDFALSVIDVNPRYLNLTADIQGYLWNSETFQPLFLNNLYSPLYFFLNESQSSGLYAFSGHTKGTLYSYGIARLFPIDSYSYIMNFTLGNLNYSSVTLNRITLEQYEVKTNLVNFSQISTVAQSSDNSAWSLSSSAQYNPRTGNHYASLSVTLQLTRKVSEVEYPT